MARRHFGMLNLHAMVGQGFLLEANTHCWPPARSFSGRSATPCTCWPGAPKTACCSTTSVKVAELLGFKEPDNKRTIERFMQKYYRVVMAIAELSDLIIQHFDEQILRAGEVTQATALNSRFQSTQRLYRSRATGIFKRTPFAIMEIFVVMAQNPEIEGICADTIRLLRDHRYLIDDEFRNDIRNTSLFIELFKCKEGIHRNLRRMNRYGILGLYLPEFGLIVGQMQHDLFHIYTVDAHTLNVIKHLRKLTKPGVAEKFPWPVNWSTSCPSLSWIYLAGILPRHRQRPRR